MSEFLWYEELLDKHPKLFKHLSYIECDKGWLKLIDGLATIIANHVAYSVPDDAKDDIFAVQVKQKFGGLRFYMSHETPFITGAIAVAEEYSFSVCETCGNLGSRRSAGGWITTLCDTHYELLPIK